MLKPEPVTTYLPKPLIKRLKDAAKRDGILMREVFRQAALLWLEKQEEKRA